MKRIASWVGMSCSCIRINGARKAKDRQNPTEIKSQINKSELVKSLWGVKSKLKNIGMLGYR